MARDLAVARNLIDLSPEVEALPSAAVLRYNLGIGRCSMAVHEKPRRRDVPGAASEFWHGPSFEDLARLQGVKPMDRIEVVLGGWPAEELEDGFEAELADWRGQSLRNRNGA